MTHRGRPLMLGERAFSWYVASDPESAGELVLQVASEDRHVVLRYHLAQPDETRFVVVVGREFRGAHRPGPWRRYRSPAFGAHDRIAPSDVRALLEWALAREPMPDEVDYLGRPLRAAGDA